MLVQEKLSDIVFPEFSTPDVSSMSQEDKMIFSYAVQMKAAEWLPINIRILNVAASTSIGEKKTTVLPNQKAILLSENSVITRSNDNARGAVYLHSLEKFGGVDKSKIKVGQTGAIIYKKDDTAYMKATAPAQKYLYEIDLGDDAPEDLKKHVDKFILDVTNRGEKKLTAKEVAENVSDAIAVHYATMEAFTSSEVKNKIAPPALMDISVYDLTKAKEELFFATAEAIKSGMGFVVNEVNLNALIEVTDNLDRPFERASPTHQPSL